MAIHPDFPKSPHDILDPSVRWFPADEALRDTTSDKLLPPLVTRLRREVKAFRDGGYVGATETSRTLLNWWFRTEHLKPSPGGVMSPFQYYFAQREALETVVYLVDVSGAKDKYDLMRFDSTGAVSAGMFDESWRRYVIKMATGSGKTKVMSLCIAWSYFHRMYEPGSELARNFLLIAPNIIVLDRLRKDFEGNQIFNDDPVIPPNGHEGRNWQDDFQLTLHIQDDVRVTQPTGNLFLTNIHRVYDDNTPEPTADDENTLDYFFGRRPTGATTDSKVDLGVIVREIDELAVLNDEAHHIHDKSLAWFKSIEDIHNKLLQKDGRLAFQLDVTATPKHNNGAIFVQTVADYPLVEAIYQDVVKHPVLPDMASRGKLQERPSARFTEKYEDYLHLGVIEWRKAFAEHEKLGKKAILFVMTDDTKNCDEVAEYLESRYPDLKGGVLTIHTKNNGEISEASSGKAKEELERLRKQANEIDDAGNQYRAIVSVLMLKEGWDVRNVTTIVGLRAYSAKSNILPEQTLGRGLRKMYAGGGEELVSVVGTDAFMDFVESIKQEGVELERRPMGQGADPIVPLIVEVDEENEKKDVDELDIQIPVLTPRIHREFKRVADLRVESLSRQPVEYRQYSEEEQREIVFKDISDEKITHTTILDSAGVADYRSVIGFFAQAIMRELRLVSGYDVIYGKVKEFVAEHLFGRRVDLEDPNTLRNLSEPPATRTVITSFKKAINDLTVFDKGDAEIKAMIKLRQTRPFTVKQQEYVKPTKSIFNRIVGDSDLELEFAAFLDACDDVVSFAKNYLAVGFRLDYVTAEGGISNYIPDFIVRPKWGGVVIVETKGQQDLDVPHKMARLRQWCEDVNKLQGDNAFDYVFVDDKGFREYRPKSLKALMDAFRDYKDES